MSIFEYDAEKHMRLEKEESYEEGKTEGNVDFFKSPLNFPL